MNFLPRTVTSREIQRSYRKIFDRVKSSQEPVVVVKNNKPDVAIISIEQLEKILKTPSLGFGDLAGMWANRKDWRGKESGELVRNIRKARVKRVYGQR